jgi:hypothetical protein
MANHPHVLPQFSMSGGLLICPPYAFTVCSDRDNFIFTLQGNREVGRRRCYDINNVGMSFCYIMEGK